jgi:hypothetical protein
MMEQIAEEPAAESLMPAFRGQLWERLAEWRESLLDITDILKSYLYRLRDVEPAARRFRAFALFLKRNPDYVAPDIEELAEPPLWATRAPPLRIQGHPDLLDNATNEALIEIAARLPATPVVVKRPPKVGNLVPGGAAKDQVVAIQPKPYQLALKRLLAEVPGNGEPLSALAWKRRQREFDALPDEIWLQCILYETTLERQRTAKLRFERRELPPAHPLSGNILVRDVLVRRV